MRTSQTSPEKGASPLKRKLSDVAKTYLKWQTSQTESQPPLKKKTKKSPQTQFESPDRRPVHSADVIGDYVNVQFTSAIDVSKILVFMMAFYGLKAHPWVDQFSDDETIENRSLMGTHDSPKKHFSSFIEFYRHVRFFESRGGTPYVPRVEKDGTYPKHEQRLPHALDTFFYPPIHLPVLLQTSPHVNLWFGICKEILTLIEELKDFCLFSVKADPHTSTNLPKEVEFRSTCGKTLSNKDFSQFKESLSDMLPHIPNWDALWSIFVQISNAKRVNIRYIGAKERPLHETDRSKTTIENAFRNEEDESGKTKVHDCTNFAKMDHTMTFPARFISDEEETIFNSFKILSPGVCPVIPQLGRYAPLICVVHWPITPSESSRRPFFFFVSARYASIIEAFWFCANIDRIVARNAFDIVSCLFPNPHDPTKDGPLNSRGLYNAEEVLRLSLSSSSVLDNLREKWGKHVRTLIAFRNELVSDMNKIWKVVYRSTSFEKTTEHSTPQIDKEEPGQRSFVATEIDKKLQFEKDDEFNFLEDDALIEE